MDDLKTYYCRRIRSQVVAEKMDYLTGRVVVQCKYDNDKQRNSCLYFSSSYPDNLYPRRCLVKLAMTREEKRKKRAE